MGKGGGVEESRKTACACRRKLRRPLAEVCVSVCVASLFTFLLTLGQRRLDLFTRVEYEESDVHWDGHVKQNGADVAATTPSRHRKNVPRNNSKGRQERPFITRLVGLKPTVRLNVERGFIYRLVMQLHAGFVRFGEIIGWNYRGLRSLNLVNSRFSLLDH